MPGMLDEKPGMLSPTEQGLAMPMWWPVQLPPEEEAMFQADIRARPWWADFVERYGEEPDLHGDYDYRRAWLSGLLPFEPGEHGLSRDPGSEMWLKDPRNHPTAWKEIAAAQGLRDVDSMDRATADELLRQLEQARRALPMGGRY